jgi:hypothetical protein
MPLYQGVANSTVRSPIPGRSIGPGESAPVFGTWVYPWRIPDDITMEAIPVAGAASVPVCIEPNAAKGVPPSVDVEIVFSADPGVISIEIQEANTDADAFYITPSYATYTIAARVQRGALFVARADFSPTGGTFLRIKATTITNAVNWMVIFHHK